MPSSFVPLTGGAYETRSLIGSAQRSVNFVVEQIPAQQGEPIQFIHFPRPGLTLEAFGPNATFGWRCLYTSSQGDLWGVNGNQVFWIEESGTVNLVGTLTPLTLDDTAPRYDPVSMADNGSALLIVDGSSTGWHANVITHDEFTPFSAATSPLLSGFLGGTRAEYSDTFFILNSPGTFIFYTSGSEAITFNPLDFASKVAKPDPIQICVIVQRVLWLIGTQSIEIWINSGGSGSGALVNNTFPYEALPTAQFDIGCVAPYSLARGTNEIFFLSLNQWGKGQVLKGMGQNITEISTYYICHEISTYSRIDDAIGMIFQQAGHLQYFLTFPTADVTWVYDLSNQQWHQEMWQDENGKEHRHRANCISAAYGKVYAGDWANSNLYSLDQNNHTDNGQEIVCIRAFPHQIDVQGNARINFKSLIARMQVGSPQGSPNKAPFLNTSFHATDGTLLQSYSNPNDLGATFVKISGETAVILNDAVVGSLGGSALYSISGTATTADYTLTYLAKPSAYDEVQASGSEIFVIGRANSSHNGYQASVTSDGTAYSVNLVVMNTATTVTLALGSLASGSFTVTLTMQAQAISITIQRSQDGNWLSPAGLWVGSFSTAISIEDSTYQAIGSNLLGGTWASF